MNETITLAPGEYYKLKLGIVKGAHIMYCGMPNKDAFSIAYFRGEGYQGYGLNIFYPKDSKTIKINEIKFRVVNVTPEQLTIQQDTTIY